MSVGLESRVPLLGRDLVALAEALPDHEKVSLTQGKRPLRHLAVERLPRYLTARRKRGFAVPLGALFAGPWHEPAVQWSREASSCLLDPRAASDALRSDRLAPAERWALCVLLAWEERLGRARNRAPI